MIERSLFSSTAFFLLSLRRPLFISKISVGWLLCTLHTIAQHCHFSSLLLLLLLVPFSLSLALALALPLSLPLDAVSVSIIVYYVFQYLQSILQKHPAVLHYAAIRYLVQISYNTDSNLLNKWSAFNGSDESNPFNIVEHKQL